MTNDYLVQRMGHLAIQTRDLDAAVFEAENVTGLDTVERGASRVVLTSNTRRGEVTFMSGDEPAALAVGLEVRSAADVLEITRRLKKAGVAIVSDEPYAPGSERAVRFRTQWGHVIEAHTPVPRDRTRHYRTNGVRPLRLDHASLKTTDTHGLRDLIIEILGMRLSDRTSGDEFMWFRAGDGMHHTLGIVISDVSSLHHYSFEAAQFSDLARLGDTLRSLNRKLTWGPGHHGANVLSYFTYHLDVHGALVEYSQGLTRIEEEDAYGEGDVWPIAPPASGDWIDLWGSSPPQAFVDAGIPFAA